MENSTGKREDLKQYIVKNTRELAQLTEILKQKAQTKAQTIEIHGERKPNISRKRCPKKEPKYLREN
jgi:Tfp pilus assembly protein PilP